MSYTQGPWVWFPNDNDDPTTFYSVDSASIAARSDSKPGDEVIADSIRHEADARLMATAPDLLKACEFALNWIGEKTTDPEKIKWPYYVVKNELVETLEQAIAQARGE